jgi:MOSC domain-containing protein YiiM
VLDRVASVSYVAAASPEARAEVLAAVLAALDADPATTGRESVELPYRTEVMWAGRRTIEPGVEGVVASVNRNSGGVPKPPVDGAPILARGLEGDGHHEPEPVHGGPDAAVSLYAQEAVERVREDGHAAFPGAYGENLTLLGIDWAALAPGVVLAIGDGPEGARLELTRYAAPCQTIGHWFTDRRIARIAVGPHPADARWYARVLREGPVTPGMAVRRIAADGAAAAATGGTVGAPTGGPMTETQRAGEAAPASTREELLARHAAARARRNAAEPGGHEWEQATAEVGRIEVEIAALERAMDPPRV